MNQNEIYGFAKQGNYKRLSMYKDQWDAKVCMHAAYNGNFECLRLLHENGCPWDKNTTDAACLCGSLECLRYAHENGCPWDQETVHFAIRSYAFYNVEYLFEQGCSFDEESCVLASTNIRDGMDTDPLLIDIFRYVFERTPLTAFTSGSAWKTVAVFAASHGMMDVLRIGAEHGWIEEHLVLQCAGFEHTEAFTYMYTAYVQDKSEEQIAQFWKSEWIKQLSTTWGQYIRTTLSRIDLHDWIWQTTLFKIDVSYNWYLNEMIIVCKEKIQLLQKYVFVLLSKSIKHSSTKHSFIKDTVICNILCPYLSDSHDTTMLLQYLSFELLHPTILTDVIHHVLWSYF